MKYVKKEGSSSVTKPKTMLQSVLGGTKKVLLWILTGFFAIIGLGCLASGGILGGILAIVFVALIIPIDGWQTILKKFVKGKLKSIIAAVLAVSCIFAVPTDGTADSPDSGDRSMSATVETTDAHSDDSSDAIVNLPTVSDTQDTTAPTAETTAPTTTPTTEPPTVPTSEPTSEPTTEPTTEPTAEPTAEPTTEPTAEPTTNPPHTHSFKAATCTEPRICSCGETEGSPNGHNWIDATCSAPKTCTVCGTSSGVAIGHSYSGGKCSTCGNADPNYIQETMVWIPTKGGSKYHSNAGCSNMEDPEYVTKSYAEQLGFTPCKRCH